jgi:hypothetical protein
MDRANLDAPYPTTGEMKKTVANTSALIERDGLIALDYDGLAEVKTKFPASKTKLRVN